MKIIFLIIVFLFGSKFSICQINQFSKSESIPSQLKFFKKTKNVFTKPNSFIENVGQYGNTLKGKESFGKILFAYEGFDMPVLFTPKGLIYLQRKVKSPSRDETEELEKKGIREAE